MDRMSPLDASFLHIEDSDRTVGMHIGSVTIFEGPPPSQELIAERVGRRLAHVPRYRQRVEHVPLAIGRPVWVDDADFQLDYHLRRTALPEPGGEAELRRLEARVMSQRLDRAKPLWEVWVVEGLADDQWAMVMKVHHCMVDGVAGVELLAALMDLEPDPPEDPAELAPWSPEPAPQSRDLVVDAVRDLTTSQYEQLRLAGASLRRPRQAFEGVQRIAAGLISLRRVVTPAVTSTLTGSIGPHRQMAWAETTLADIKAIRAAHGGTVNDVVLAVITRGFRKLLLARGEDVEGRVVRSLVPVSVRDSRDDGAATGDGSFDNKVSAMFAELPVGLEDPVEVLGAIRFQLADLKESKQAVAGEALTSLSGFAPPALLALGTRLAARVVARTENIHTVTTNVPGPQLPLYSCGRRLLKAFPYVPLAAPIRIGVAIFSYNGAVTFGIAGDRDVSPDIDVLARGITDAIAELQERA